MSENRQTVEKQLTQLQDVQEQMHKRKLREVGPSSDPARGQGRLLQLLKMQPEISPTELVFILNMSQQAVAKQLGALETGGYIMRTPAADDANVSVITLTDAGKNIAGTMNEAMEGASVLDTLTDEEIDTLNGLLGRIIARAEELNDGLAMFTSRGGRRKQEPDEAAGSAGSTGLAGLAGSAGLALSRGFWMTPLGSEEQAISSGMFRGERTHHGRHSRHRHPRGSRRE
jgi:DNA-binding MarR family transcriptional regulator